MYAILAVLRRGEGSDMEAPGQARRQPFSAKGDPSSRSKATSAARLASPAEHAPRRRGIATPALGEAGGMRAMGEEDPRNRGEEGFTHADGVCHPS